MNCCLCHARIDLWDLSADGYVGLPAHTWCADAERQAVADALDEANRPVVDWHEAHPRRSSAA